MTLNPTFWRNRRVLLTGHTGFKGGWLAHWLHVLGADVVGFSLPPTPDSLFAVARVDGLLHSVFGDIRDREAMRRVVQQAAPSVVFHLAAQPLVLASHDDPVGTFAANAMGTVHLLDAVRSAPSVRAVVNVTTDKCYENTGQGAGYRERDRLGGADPYSASKACAELITSAYRSSFFPPERYTGHRVALATARAGNVVGGGDRAPDRLVPDLLAAFQVGRVASLRRPDAVRPWQHVLEPLHGYLLLAQRLVADGPAVPPAFNFGPTDGTARTVAWVADTLAACWGGDAAWASTAPPTPATEATFLQVDSELAHRALGWMPRYALSHALERVVAWHRAWCDGADMAEVTRQHIRDYQSLLNRRIAA